MDQNSITLIVGGISLVLGAILGGGSALAIINRILEKAKNDPSAVALGEHWFNSLPIPLVKNLLKNLAEYIGKVTDDIPASDQTNQAAK